MVAVEEVLSEDEVFLARPVAAGTFKGILAGEGKITREGSGTVPSASSVSN